MRQKLNPQPESRRRPATDVGRRTRSSLHSALRTPHSALIFLLFGLLLASTLSTQAQVSSNRFLFIVDTSAAMKRHGPDILNLLNGLIVNGASGQMHAGDSLGLWTFNDDVYSDLPVQTWGSAEPTQIARHTTDFLRHQPFGKTGRLDLALGAMQEIIKASDIITIFIISSGDGKMTGTPFDAEINDQYRQALKGMGRQPRLVVTVLQAKGGKLLQYTVNALPWPVVVPEVPIPIKMAQAAPRPATANPPAAHQSATPPVVSQTQPAQPANSNPPQQNPIPAAPPAASPVPPPTITTPVYATKPAPVVKPEGAPVIATAPPPITPQSAPAQTPTPAPPTQSAPASTSPPPPPNFSVPPLPNFAPPRPPGIANRTPPPLAQNNSLANNPPQAPPPLPTNQKPPPSPVPTDQVPAKAPTVTATPAKTVPLVQDNSSVPPAVAVPATNSLSTRALAFVEPDSASRPKSLLIAAAALLFIGALLILLMVRRSRTTSGPSLITHSMGNGKKK